MNKEEPMPRKGTQDPSPRREKSTTSIVMAQATTMEF